jgi:hypothetical protein
MKKFFQFLLCLALAATSLGAQTNGKKAAAVELPPLIDRELIFGNPEIVNAVLSPDGKYLAFQKPWHDTRNIYVKGVDEPFNAARLLTTETKRPSLAISGRATANTFFTSRTTTATKISTSMPSTPQLSPRPAPKPRPRAT